MSTDMDACMQAAVPGEAHERLKQFEGTWKANVQHWMEPGQTPHTSTGVMTSTWILDHRFLRQDYKGDFAGSTFEGTGLFGYNNVTGRYEGLWIDNMSTGMMTETGGCDAAGRVWEMLGDTHDPCSGAKLRKRSLITVHAPDHHTMEMYFQSPDGEFKAMQIDYRRQR